MSSHLLCVKANPPTTFLSPLRTSPHLKNDLLVYGELGDDVGQQQVTAVFAGRVHAGFREQAWPGEGHEAPQLAVPGLVVVVDVMRRMLHQQGGELQQANPQRVQQVGLLLGVKDLGEEWSRCWIKERCVQGHWESAK